MRLYRLLVLLFPVLAACSCDESVENAAGTLLAEPSSLDFGGVFVGSTARQPVAFRNRGATTVTVTPADLPAGFSLEPARVEVAPGGVTDAEVLFKPVEVARYDGTLPFDTAGAKNEQVTIEVLGEGLQRTLVVEQKLDFGIVEVGETATLPLPIASESGGTVKATFAISGGTDFAVDLAELELEPGASGELQVSFTPSTVGPLSARLVIHTCTTCKDVIVQLIGEGGVADLQPSPVSLDFGTVSPGNRRVRTLDLRNRGAIPITVAGATFTVDKDFEVDLSLLPREIGGGETVTIEVAFAPPEDAPPGSQQSALEFVGADDAVLFQVPVSGKSGGPELRTLPENIDFGMQPLGLEVHRSVALANVGEAADLRVVEVRVDGPASMYFLGTSQTALPAAIGSTPLVFDVAFKGLEVGDHQAELVIVTNDDEQPEVRVPLLGNSRELPPCDLVVTPPNVRFGLVEVGKEYVRDVELTNAGQNDCLVWDVHLDPNGSWMFELEEPPTGTQVIPAGGVLTVDVKYTPQLLEDTIDVTELRYSHSTPETPQVALPVSGLSGRYMLTGTPVDFGAIPLGLRRFDAVTITNHGSTSATVERVSIAPDMPDFGTHETVAVPGELTSGSQGLVQVSYKANQVGVDEGLLEVWMQGASEPFLVDLVGESLDEECGDYCLGPQAQCPADQTTNANTEVPLIGAGSDPTGDPLECRWRVTQRPSGSTVEPADPDSCVTTFRPDIVGDYEILLIVTDPMGNEATCTTHVTANPFGGLWIEMYWDVANDIDLHLGHPNGGNPTSISSWFNATNDCYYANCASGASLPWDSGSTNDDPFLDRDDTTTTGPENTRISQPDTSHVYSIGIHYFSSGQNPNASVDVTVNVYCGGSLLHSSVSTVTDSNSGDGDLRDFYVLGSVQYSTTSACTWTGINTMLEY